MWPRDSRRCPPSGGHGSGGTACRPRRRCGRGHRDRGIPAVLWQPEPDAAAMVAVTDRAGDGDRPAEGPAAVGRAGEPDAVAADPGHIDIVAVDGLLSLRVLARATLADLGNRPDVRPVPAA